MRRRLVLGMEGTQNRAAQLSQGEGTPCSRTGMRQPPLDHAGASLLFLGLPPLFRAPSLGGFCCYLFISSVHLLPTLVSYPCIFSSARPLSHFFWRSVSCCGPYRPIQGSHPHQRGSGCQLCVFNTDVTTFPGVASPPIPLWLAHMGWNLFGDPRVDVLGRCDSFFSHDFGLPRTGSSLAVRFDSLDSLHFVPGHFFLLGVGLGFEMEWAEASRTFWPHTIYKRIILFGLDFYMIQKYRQTLHLIRTKLEDILVKIYFQLRVKCLQNRKLSYYSISSKQIYPKIKKEKEKEKNILIHFDIYLKAKYTRP